MAESSRRKVACIDTKDRVSELPKNLKETILAYLPIQDAVRSCVLSTKWRHSWTMIPNLIFDEEFSDHMRDKQRHMKDQNLRAYKFCSVINKLLLRHNDPILKFCLVFDDGCLEVISDYIYQWIPLLSRKGIKQLTLDNRITNFFEFKTHHFSCLELTHLKLSRTRIFSIPAFKGFLYLTNLELNIVHHREEDIFDCPMLERLSLMYCEGISHINFYGPKLTYLKEVYHFPVAEYYVMALSRLRNLKEFSFCCFAAGPAKSSNLVKVLNCLHRIEKFSVGLLFIQYLAAGGSPIRLPKPLLYLKNLNISNVEFTDLSVISCILCLIRSAPNLCKLQLSASRCYANKESMKNYQVEDSQDITISQLEIVTFSNLSGYKAELELIKFLLAHSPLLKTMVIHRHTAMKKNAALAMTEEITQFSRVSPRAQIWHLKNPVEIVELRH